MDTGQVLLQAILESPDDDMPRLVYADWLEETGRPERAEFIRLGLKLHRPNQHRNVDDERRQADLLPLMRESWLKEMPQFPGVRWRSFFRGFPTVQVNDWPALKKHAARLWAVSPCEGVCFNGLSGPGGRALAESPWLIRIRELSFGWVGRHGMPGLAALLQSLSLANLRVLDLKSCGLGDEGVIELAWCPHLTELEELVLECNDVGDRGALALARTPHYPKLKRLWLGRNPFEDVTAIRELQRRWGKHCC